MFRGKRDEPVAKTVVPDPFSLSSTPLALPSPGDHVHLELLGVDGLVGDMLGQGGQGAVFALTLPGDEREFALKWYYPHSATPAQRVALTALLDQGRPHERFLWPIDLAAAASNLDTGGFGYVMARRPANFVGLADLMSRRVDAPMRTLATLGLELSHAFLLLHNQGLCYRDISFGNVFFDPTTGTVLVCDNDNVGIDGQSSSQVRGTPYFMAPEIVRGEALPSRNTDLWSLAVLLFYLLMVSHPLEGARSLEHDVWNEAAMRALFGEHPIFIFDPVDESNRPVPGLHDNAVIFWDLYPKFIRDLFTTAFTDGIGDPENGRVRESVWRTAMVRLQDAVVYCQDCGRQNVFDDTRPPPECWSCGVTIAVPPRLRFGRNVVVLNHDTKIATHHMLRDYDFETKIAEVCEHPEHPGVWGLRNLGTRAWNVTDAQGAVVEVEPGRATPLLDGVTIDFGSSHATVEG